jgi:hypothetical protein
MLRRLEGGSNCTASRDFSHAALIVRTVEKDLQKSGLDGLFFEIGSWRARLTTDDSPALRRQLCLHADESGVDDD